MRVRSFIGANSTWAFTGTGAIDLPVSGAPWQRHKQYNMHRGQKLDMAVDVDWIIDAVESGGYYLTVLTTKPRLGRAPTSRGWQERRAYRTIGPALIVDDITRPLLEGACGTQHDAARRSRQRKKPQLTE